MEFLNARTGLLLVILLAAAFLMNSTFLSGAYEKKGVILSDVTTFTSGTCGAKFENTNDYPVRVRFSFEGGDVVEFTMNKSEKVPGGTGCNSTEIGVFEVDKLSEVRSGDETCELDTKYFKTDVRDFTFSNLFFHDNSLHLIAQSHVDQDLTFLSYEVYNESIDKIYGKNITSVLPAGGTKEVVLEGFSRGDGCRDLSLWVTFAKGNYSGEYRPRGTVGMGSLTGKIELER